MEKEQGWKALRLRGLRQRWIFNSILPIGTLLVLVVTLFSAGVSNYYYGTMQKGLETRAQALANSFNEYFMDNGFSSYYQKAVQSAESFEDKNRIELQFIGSSGRIQVSTSGLTAGTYPGTDDILQVLRENKTTPTPYQGRDLETGEEILAVSCPLTANGRVVGVMRLVTSLRAVDRQVMFVVLAILLVALLCMLLVVFSNLLFINNVVEPVAVVTEAAKRISAGSYGTRIENKYSDELGELVDNINDMSLKINQNEKMKRFCPRAPDPSHRHQRLGGDHPGGRPHRRPRAAPPGHPGHRQRVPALVHHGGGAAGLLQDGGRPLHPPD